MPKYQQTQTKSNTILEIPMQEAQVDISSSPFFPMDRDSPIYQFPEPELDLFNTKYATTPFMSDTLLGDVDRTMWSHFAL